MKLNVDLPQRVIEKCRNDGLCDGIKSAYKYPLRKFLSVEQRYSLYSWTLRVAGHPGIGNPLRVYRIDPRDIEYIYSGDSTGFVADGDWDLRGKKHVDDWFRMKMFTKHFRYGIPWKEIDEYQILESKIRDQGYVGTLDIPKEEHSVEKLYDYHKFIDDLYDRIKNDGYKSQKELNSDDDFANRERHPSLSEIQVRISRDGEMMPSTGYHRFTIAKILGIKSVPVRTASRHLEWQKIRNEVCQADSKSELKPDKQKYIGHPELEDVTSFS